MLRYISIMSIEPSNQTSQNTSQNDGRSVHEFEARFNRLKDACGATNDSALARCLDITQGSIGVAKKRLKIPSGWIEQIAVKYGVSTDWLFFGIGQKLIDKAHIASAETQKSDIIPEGEPQWMSAKEAAEGDTACFPRSGRAVGGEGTWQRKGPYRALCVQDGFPSSQGASVKNGPNGCHRRQHGAGLDGF